jgi:hypothetical protein
VDEAGTIKYVGVYEETGLCGDNIFLSYHQNPNVVYDREDPIKFHGTRFH